jgi:PadR family transcriptional regulator, regulatory protein AphA
VDYPKTARLGRQGWAVSTAAPDITATEAAILGLLGAGELSGYDLAKSVEKGVGMFWAPARSGIYAVLPRLVDKGYATRRVVAQKRRPDKQLYRITKEGRAALRRWIESGPPEPDPAHNPFLLRVYFGAETEPGVVAEHVETRRAEALERIALHHKLEAEMDGPDAALRDRYRRIVLDWGLEYYEAVVRWADATLRELRKLERDRQRPPAARTAVRRGRAP